MLVPISEQSDRGHLILPIGLNLRECSVVIIGSTCQICGRDFKCVTDVALHMQWRHQQLENVLNGVLNFEDRDNCTVSMAADMKKCDMCYEHLSAEEHDATDLKFYRRQIVKKQIHEKRRARKLRLIIKIAGVTMTEIRLSRKYLKVQSNEYFTDVGTQTETTHESEERRNDYGTNIDLSLAERVVGNSHVQCVQPHKATNRYTDGELASIQEDAIACSTRALPKRPIEISNERSHTPCEDASIGANGRTLCASPVLYPRKVAPPSSQARTARSFVSRFDGTRDLPNLTEANSSPARGSQARRDAASPAAQDTSILEDQQWYRRNRSPRDSIAHEQLCRPEAATAGGAATTSTSTPNSSCSKNPRRAAWSSERSGSRSAEPIEIIIDNENDEETTKRSSGSSNQVARESRPAAESDVDDDVQEILRITRGKAQGDINHESPNRTEREMLVQKYVTSTQPVYPEEDDTLLVVSNNNIDPRDCPPYVTIVDDDCPFPNMATFMYKTCNNKLDICLNKWRDYSIGYYNDLPEINNNG